MTEIIKQTPYDYFETKRAIRKLCTQYPFLQTTVIGRTAGGRDMPLIQIGRAEEYVLFTGAFHGSEHITIYLLLKFIEEISDAIKNDTPLAGFNIRRIMTGRGILFAPVVNPDGVEISIHGFPKSGYSLETLRSICKGDHRKWNANQRGVDINHNFDADWVSLHRKERDAGIYGPAKTRFGGYKPESELETQALVKLCRTVRIRHALAFHSQGEVIYWNYGDKIPPRAQKMAEIMASSSGYELDTPESIATGGGFKDWFIKEFGRPGFTIEVGKGENPLPIADYEAVYNRLREMLILSIAM